MSIGLKIVVGLGLACAAFLFCATALIGGATVAGGLARVSIRSADGPDLNLAVPGVLISAAAATGGHLVEFGDRHHRYPRQLVGVELEREVHAAMAARLMREMLGALEEIPDATLVEVEDGGDRVRIIKRGGYLRLWVVDGGGDLDLEVSVPIRTARRTVAHLLG